MRQAAERNVSEASNLANAMIGGNGSLAIQKQQQQQAAVCAPFSLGTDPLAAPGTAALGGLTPQQISQAFLASGGRLDPALAQSLLYPASLRGAASGVEVVTTPTPVPAVPASTNNILANAMQQLALQQYLQAQANAQQQQVQQQQAQAQAVANAAATNGHQQAALLAMTLAAGKGQLLPTAAPTVTTNNTGGATAQQASAGAQQQQQQAQIAQTQALLQHAAQQQQLNSAGFTAIKPANAGIQQQAQAIQQKYHFQNGSPGAAGAANLPSMMKIAAAGGRILPSAEMSPPNPVGAKNAGENRPSGGKKQQKRAANRRSAQLSRKRKKQFIEELKDENDDLRRKEQILRAIPDLIVVFDSSGRLGFVSESVGRFLDVSPEKLEGTSFWDLICEESVRMLKAAFMDSLAAREVESETAVLGSGVWELRLIDKNSKYMIVTLNGVVHFKGDAPECVCCIRPLGEEQTYRKQLEKQTQKQQQKQSHSLKTDALENSNNIDSGNGPAKSNKNVNHPVSCSDGDASRSSDGSNRTQQSVMNSRHMSSSGHDEAAIDAKKRNKKFRRMMASADDGNSSSSNSVEADGTNNSVRISDGDSNDGIESD
jgi:PAS domain-containing protein